MYLKILACKSQEFLGNRYLLCQFPSEYSIHNLPQVSLPILPIHHLWMHHCCWPDHSQNSCQKQLELLILSAQECMVTSRIFRSQSFFRFLTSCQTKVQICWRTFCQIRWPENSTWLYCLQCGDKTYPYMTSLNFLISWYGKLDS